MQPPKAQFRNCFDIDEEPEEWREVLEQFPNEVPRFSTKEAAKAFTLEHCRTPSNPDYPTLYHSITTLIDWQQIENHLLPRIRSYYDKFGRVSAADVDNPNPYLEQEQANNNPIAQYLQSRLNLSIHRQMSFVSTLNTLKYMFFHLRCGIFVMIRNNKVVIFCPFVNKDYENNWASALQISAPQNNIEKYYGEKLKYYREENYLSDVSKWWANGNIMCNELQTKHESPESNQHWGDHFLLQLKDMFAECCNERTVPDCEFFINKRDYPHLKINVHVADGIPVEPYGFIYDRDDRDPAQDVPLTRHFYKSYTPIL